MPRFPWMEKSLAPNGLPWKAFLAFSASYGIFLFSGNLGEPAFLLSFWLTATWCSGMAAWMAFEWFRIGKSLPLRAATVWVYTFLGLAIGAGFLHWDFTSSAAILVGCGLMGGLFSRYIRTWDVLFALSLSILAVDFLSVFFGPAKLIAGNDFFAYLVTVKFPLMGSGEVSPIIGFADILFFGIFFAVCEPFGLPLKPTFHWLLGATVATVGLTCWLQTPLPLLPSLVAAFLVLHRKALFSSGINYRKSLRLVGAAAFVFVLFALCMKGIWNGTFSLTS